MSILIFKVWKIKVINMLHIICTDGRDNDYRKTVNEKRLKARII